MVGIAILKLCDVPIVKFVNSNLVGIRKISEKGNSDWSDKILTRNSIKCKEAAHNKELDSCNVISGAW